MELLALIDKRNTHAAADFASQLQGFATLLLATSLPLQQADGNRQKWHQGA